MICGFTRQRLWGGPLLAAVVVMMLAGCERRSLQPGESPSAPEPSPEPIATPGPSPTPGESVQEPAPDLPDGSTPTPTPPPRPAIAESVPLPMTPAAVAPDAKPEFAFSPAYKLPAFVPGRTLVIDVTKPPYNARGDGRTDATVAIQRAIADAVYPADPRAPKELLAGKQMARTIYIPDGTYLIRDTLVAKDAGGNWRPYLSIQGQSREKTILRVPDASPNFADRTRPRAVLMTASEQAADVVASRDEAGMALEQKLAESGGGNKAFDNHISNLTILTGSKNPGARGIDYLANNHGTLENVAILSGDGAGDSGLELTRDWIGPALVRDVHIRGFSRGIRIKGGYSMTFENVFIEDPGSIGVEQTGSVAAFRRLFVSNAPLHAYRSVEADAATTIVDAVFTGTGKGIGLRVDDGSFYGRNLFIEGFREPADIGGQKPGVPHLAEILSGNLWKPAWAQADALKLPIEDTPPPPQDSDRNVAVVEDFGAVADDGRDDSAAVQKAIDSGKGTIIFARRAGRSYQFDQPVIVRGNVRLIDGLFASVAGTFVIESPVTLRRIAATVDNRSAGPLVLKQWHGDWTAGPPGAKVFLEDAAPSPGNRITPGVRVWARQWNTENRKNSEPNLVNEAGDLWMLGLKTEMPTTIIRTRHHGRTEILGGYVNPIIAAEKEVPAFLSENAEFSGSFSSVSHGVGKAYDKLVSELDGGVVTTLSAGAIPESGNARHVPLYSSRRASGDLQKPIVEIEADAARILVTRSGDRGDALIVPLEVSGSAKPGEDISAIPPEVTIPVGEAAATVGIQPGSPPETLRTLTVSIAPSDAYEPGGNRAATLTFQPVRDPTVLPAHEKLALWLAADAAVKLQTAPGGGYLAGAWSDLSDGGAVGEADGEGHMAAWDPEAMNGRPGLIFDKDHYAFVETSKLGLRDSYRAKSLAMVFRTGSTVVPRQLLWKQGGYIRGLNIYLRDGMLYAHVFNVDKGAWGQVHASLPVEPDTDCILVVVADSVTGTLTLTLNGKTATASGVGLIPKMAAPEVFKSTTCLGSLQGGALPLFHDGQQQTRYGLDFQGVIAEVIQWNTALDAAQQQAAIDLLARKYGLAP